MRGGERTGRAGPAPPISCVTLAMAFKPLFPALLLSLCKEGTRLCLFPSWQRRFPSECAGKLAAGGWDALSEPREQGTRLLLGCLEMSLPPSVAPEFCGSGQPWGSSWPAGHLAGLAVGWGASHRPVARASRGCTEGKKPRVPRRSHPSLAAPRRLSPASRDSFAPAPAAEVSHGMSGARAGAARPSQGPPPRRALAVQAAIQHRGEN